MTSRAQAPPAELDMRALELEPAAKELRAWALSEASELLAEPGQPLAPALRRSVPTRDRLRALRPYLGSTPALRSRLARRPRALGGLRFHDQPQVLLQPLSQRMARSLKVDKATFLRRFMPRIARPRVFLPEALWPVVTEMAWREPRFQYQIAFLIQACFRRRQLIPGGALPAPIVHPAAFWLLLALVAVSSLAGCSLLAASWLPGFMAPPYLRLRRLHRGPGRGWPRRVSELALAQCLSRHGWAGFWEQWLIGEAMLRHPERVLGAAVRSRQLLGVLPLLGEEAYRETRNRIALVLPPGEDFEAGRRIVDPAWRKHRPPWFASDTETP